MRLPAVNPQAIKIVRNRYTRIPAPPSMRDRAVPLAAPAVGGRLPRGTLPEQ